MLVRWPRTFVGRSATWLDADQASELAEHEPGLMFSFVVGAPAMLLSNAAGQPTKRLANGSPAIFHSLTFEGETPREYDEALERGGFHEIVLDEPPLSVNIVPDLEQRDDNYGIESLISPVCPSCGSNDAQSRGGGSHGMCCYGCAACAATWKQPLIVAVLEERQKWRKTHSCVSLFAASSVHVPKTLQYTGHPVTCALTLTNFKMQGGTFPKLIVSAHPKPFPPHLNLEAWYVFISRPKTLEGLRLLCKPTAREGGLQNVTDLRHAPEMRVWNQGYDDDGHWSVARAKAAAAKVIAQPASKQPRRRQYRRSAEAKATDDARMGAAGVPLPAPR